MPSRVLCITKKKKTWICYKWLFCILFSLVFQVGILDADLCGPSVPRMVNMEGKTYYGSEFFWVSHNKINYSIHVVSNDLQMFLTVTIFYKWYKQLLTVLAYTDGVCIS